jgi:hypothetical protein
MLQGVELSFGERGDAARCAVHFASFPPPMLGQCGHDSETLSGLTGEGNGAPPHSPLAGESGKKQSRQAMTARSSSRSHAHAFGRRLCAHADQRAFHILDGAFLVSFATGSGQSIPNPR